MMNNTVEQQASDILLQKPFTVKAGDKEYTVARPTLATLAEVSSILSTMSTRAKPVDRTDIVREALGRAKDDVPRLALIAATLIIGGGNITYHTEHRESGRILGLFKRYEKVCVSNVQVLADELQRTASSEEMHRLVTAALSFQGVGFFLSTIISLSAAAVTAPTKSGTAATARGE